jgi:hypothetical protein
MRRIKKMPIVIASRSVVAFVAVAAPCWFLAVPSLAAGSPSATASLDLLAKHRIREGMPLCLEVMHIQAWGKRGRISRCLKTLGQYGAAAKPMLPQLRQLEKDLLAHGEARGLRPQIDQLRSLITEIENATGTVELRSIDDP